MPAAGGWQTYSFLLVRFSSLIDFNPRNPTESLPRNRDLYVAAVNSGVLCRWKCIVRNSQLHLQSGASTQWLPDDTDTGGEDGHMEVPVLGCSIDSILHDIPDKRTFDSRIIPITTSFLARRPVWVRYIIGFGKRRISLREGLFGRRDMCAYRIFDCTWSGSRLYKFHCLSQSGKNFKNLCPGSILYEVPRVIRKKFQR
jgi:hypothetical protein